MVTAMPGGAADKAGNRYEHLWVVLRITELMEGSASRIRLEPPGQAGTGIELEIDVDGVIWGEQTKDSASNWTINKLISEGVLASAKVQLDRGRCYRLIVSSSAHDLSTLAYRARKCDSLDEYTEALGQGRMEHLTEAAGAWGLNQEQAWLLLKRIEVENYSLDALNRIVAGRLQQSFLEDWGLIAGELRNFCDSRVHEHFTGPQVNAHLVSKGLTRRLIAGDENVIDGLRKTRERHQRRAKQAEPTIGLVPRDDIDTIIAMLRDPKGAQIVVLDGRAGSGKSSVVSEVASGLEEDGWFVAVARMDINRSFLTSKELGESIGLEESPSVLLAGVSAGQPSLLVVDQLDAVSTYSGRMADHFESVEEVLAEIERAQNVKVLLVVRTVDLDRDPRLRKLVQAEHRIGKHTLDDLDIEAVKELIVESGLSLPNSEVTLNLLCIPLHLSVYCRLSSSGQDREYATLQDLYASYTDELRSRLEHRVGQFDWDRTVGGMVNYMSDHEVLAAPVGALDSVSNQVCQALISESVVVRDEEVVAFFHESYFDYLFARSFVASGGNLHEFLLQSGQYLFRRAQTRQVLDYLAATDRSQFREVVVQLMNSDEIRFHLKTVVVSVLRQTQPMPEDWIALEPLVWEDTPLASKLSLLLNVSGWFDAADTLGRWEEWLNDPQIADQAFYPLSLLAKSRGTREANLVRPHIGESEEWRRRLKYMISWALNSQLVDLAIELVERGELDDALNRSREVRDFWSMLYSLRDEDPAGAARLIGACLRRGLACAQEAGSVDPFESGHLSTNSQSASIIKDVAVAAPEAFIENVLPFIIDVALADQYEREGLLPASRRWGYTHWLPDYTVDKVVMNAVDEALQKLAIDNPEKCSEFLTGIRSAESSELRYLVCRALSAKHDSDDAVSWLISDPRNFDLGWSDFHRWASRELIEGCSSDCSSYLFEKLQDAIVSYSPDRERRPYQGYSQYFLLSALDLRRMSPFARRRLQELERRFSDSPPQAPRVPVAQTVTSPISESASEHMSDDDWIRALTKYNEDRSTWIGHELTGGAVEAAHTLGQRVKDDPERYSKLALRFTVEIPSDAMSEVIRNVEGIVDVETLTELCEHAHSTYGTDVGRTVCSAIARAGKTNPRLIALLAMYICDADPEHETARSSAEADGVYWGEDLFTAGLNSTRGEAALAVASTLFSGPDHLDLLLPLLEDLIEDDILAVRVCAAQAVIALLIYESEIALDFAERLFNAPIDVLDAHSSERLLGYATLRDPDRFAPVLEAALVGPDEIAMRAGGIWAALRWAGQLPLNTAVEFRSLPASARRGAARAFAGHVADSHSDILQALQDDDPEVLEQLGSALGQLNELATPDQVALVDAVMESAVFPNHMQTLIHALEEMTSTLPVNTIDVCERVVEIEGTDLGDVRTGAALISSDLITVVLRLYRQGNAALRARCLDIIDRLAEFSVYDLELALENER